MHSLGPNSINPVMAKLNADFPDSPQLPVIIHRSLTTSHGRRLKRFTSRQWAWYEHVHTEPATCCNCGRRIPRGCRVYYSCRPHTYGQVECRTCSPIPRMHVEPVHVW